MQLSLPLLGRHSGQSESLRNTALDAVCPPSEISQLCADDRLSGRCQITVAAHEIALCEQRSRGSQISVRAEVGVPVPQSDAEVHAATRIASTIVRKQRTVAASSQVKSRVRKNGTVRDDVIVVAKTIRPPLWSHEQVNLQDRWLHHCLRLKRIAGRTWLGKTDRSKQLTSIRKLVIPVTRQEDAAVWCRDPAGRNPHSVLAPWMPVTAVPSVVRIPIAGSPEVAVRWSRSRWSVIQ